MFRSERGGAYLYSIGDVPSCLILVDFFARLASTFFEATVLGKVTLHALSPEIFPEKYLLPNTLYFTV